MIDMHCPKCGSELKTCCQLAREEAQVAKSALLITHGCGFQKLICSNCHHHEFAPMIYPVPPELM